MNTTIEVVLRYLLTMGFTVLATKGLISSDAASGAVDATVGLISALVPFAMMGWGIYRNRAAGKIADVAAMPGVTSIHATPEIANAQPSDKVVSVPPAAP